MAGAMGAPRRQGRTLAERSALTRVTDAERRHCWVAGPPEAPGPWPGVLVEWRLEGQQWWGRVVCVVNESPPVLVEAWLDASKLRPA